MGTVQNIEVFSWSTEHSNQVPKRNRSSSPRPVQEARHSLARDADGGQRRQQRLLPRPGASAEPGEQRVQQQPQVRRAQARPQLRGDRVHSGGTLGLHVPRLRVECQLGDRHQLLQVKADAAFRAWKCKQDVKCSASHPCHILTLSDGSECANKPGVASSQTSFHGDIVTSVLSSEMIHPRCLIVSKRCGIRRRYH